ncbi:MAG: hypothetical protein KJ737_12555 [Proteobacteria bacterium]|nr:hypothetical protein [Pseudomonadota bacterium]
MSSNADKGVIDAVDRILGQLLKKPVFKSSIRTVLNNIDPDSSKRLARTILWEDMEVTMAFVAAIPSLANALILFGDEVLVQVNEKFPQALLNGYMEEIADNIDMDTIGRIKQNASRLFDELSVVLEKSISGKTDTIRPEKGEMFSTGGKKDRLTDDDKDMDDEAKSKTSITQEVLKTGFLKDILRECLNAIDPQNGAAFVQSVLWQDMDVPFSVLAALPVVVNWYINAIDEIGIQLIEKIPPRLLKEYVEKILTEMDTETAKHSLVNFKKMIEGVIADMPEFESNVFDFVKGPMPATVFSSAINGSINFINKIETKNPGTVSMILTDVISKIDKNGFNRAAEHATHALLDQNPPFFSILFRLIKVKIKRKFMNNHINKHKGAR